MNESKFRFDQGAGWIVSVILHACLAFFFLYVTFDRTEETTDYAELTFSNFVASDTQDINRQMSSTPAAAPSRNNRETRPTRLVDVPTRRMTEREETVIPEYSKNKVQTEENARRVSDKVDPLSGVSRERNIKTNTELAGERKTAGAATMNIGEKTTTKIPSEGIGGSVKSSKPYDISWEGGAREIISDPVPSYPEGVYKEVVLKIKITVLPNGTIREMIPLQKGDATLEAVTMQALKRWRFNPLEKSAPQVNQIATVSFKFVLKE